MTETDVAVAAGAGGSPAVTRAEWLAWRRLGLGSTDIAAIRGRSPWASPWSVWASKVGLAPDDDEDPAPQQQLGRDLEPVIARWFRAETGLDVAGEQMMLHHPHGPWFATVDGLVVHPDSSGIDDALGVFEAKYTGDAPWDEVPDHYVEQVQWAMACSGLAQAWVAVMHLPFGRPRFEVHEVARDDERIADMLAAAERFWFGHVVTGTPPPADAHRATTSALAAAWIDPVAEPAVDLGGLADVVDELRAFKDAARQLDTDIRAHENAIRAALGERTEGVVGGQLVCSWRQQARTDVDREAIRRDHGEAYDVRSTHRVLRLHGRKST